MDSFTAGTRVTVTTASGSQHAGQSGTVAGTTEASVALDTFGGDVEVALDCGPDGMYGWSSLTFPPQWLTAEA